MNEIQWYYAHDDQRFGPVSTVELKRLAERGQLAKVDLVWREGMPDWVEASHVKGLFSPAASESSGHVAAAPSTQPAPQQAPPMQPAPAEPIAAKPKAPMRHPVEAILSLARSGASEGFVDSSIRLFVLLGHYAMYVAMLLVLVGGVAISVQLEMFIPALLAVAMVPVLAVMQYAAGQFSKALDRVNRTTRATVASTTLVDLIGLVSLVLGPILLLAIAAHAVMASAWTFILTALVVFIILEHLAAVSFIHVDSGVIVSDQLTPGEEALGTLCALLKVSARVVPVAFGAGVSCCTIVLGIACVQCLRGGENLNVTGMLGLSNVSMITLFAALPMIGYLGFLLLALLFDVIDGLLG